MRLIFLDVDGVLNHHLPHPGSVYNGIHPDCMARLNRILQATDASLILSSAWRYQIICGATTMRGFEFLMYSHGLIPRKSGAPWFIGHTPSDEAIEGRGRQISAALYSLLPREPFAYVVLDDLDPGISEAGHPFVKTNPSLGLTDADVERAIALLMEESK